VTSERRATFRRTAASVTLCLLTTGCHVLPFGEDHSNHSYTIEVRCHTQEGTPIPNVRIANPDSGASGYTDAQGKLSFRLDGHEGAEVTLKVESAPEGIVVAEDKSLQKLVLKSIAGPGGSGRRGLVTHDILMRKNKELYVVLVSTDGAPDLPVSLNGVSVGRLNSRGAGAFRFYGQPGEEMKVLIDTSGNRGRLSYSSSQRTFNLPSNSAILTFHSSLALLENHTISEPEQPVLSVKFEEKGSRRRHRRSRDHVKEPQQQQEPAQPKSKAPVQVPFRDIDLQKN